MPYVKRRSATRAVVESIRFHARELRDGTHSPEYALNHISSIATGWRPRYVASGEPVEWEKVPYWRIYRPFHDIAARWKAAKEQGELSPEALDTFGAELYDVALDLLGPRGGPNGERVTPRTARVVVYYEGGRRLPEPKHVVRYT